MAKIKSPTIMKGNNSQITKNKNPKIITPNKNKIPTTIVIILTKKPIPREIALKEIYSKNFPISKPRGFRVMSRFQGASNVFKSKGIEK